MRSAWLSLRPVLLAALLAVATIACGARASAKEFSTSTRAENRAHGSMSSPAWSPNGKRIAWAQGRRIWVAAANGSRARPVTAAIDALDQVQWLTSATLAYSANFRLFTLTPGGRSRLVANISDTAFAIGAHGKLVATGSPGCPHCVGHISILNLGTGAKRRVGRGLAQDNMPSLSADGSEVAFSRVVCRNPGPDCDAPAGIWVAPTAGGGEARQITPTGNCAGLAPDGVNVAYVAGSDFGPSPLRLVATSGGPSVQVGEGTSCNSGAPPKWSPDSRAVAFIDGHGLTLVDARTYRLTRARLPGPATGLSWAPDSSAVLVTSLAGCASLYRVDAKTGAARLLRHC